MTTIEISREPSLRDLSSAQSLRMAMNLYSDYAIPSLFFILSMRFSDQIGYIFFLKIFLIDIANESIK